MFYKPKRRYLPGFVSPKPNRAVIWLCKSLIDPILEYRYQITGVSVRPEELVRFARHKGQRMMLVPNHPTPGDPAVMFKLSQLAGENWFYLSNREQFDKWFGLFGKLLQLCGAYSVARGTLDKRSFLTTKSLLVDAPNKLVVFAEGGAYSWNDLEAPLQVGLFKLLLNAAREMREKGVDEPLWVQPVAIKYVYSERALPALERSLSRMERAVGLEGEPHADFRERVLRLGARIVASVEQGFFGRQFLAETPHQRFDRVREEMLGRFAHTIGAPLPPPESGTMLERTRSLFDAFYKVSLEGMIPSTTYEEKLFDDDALAMASVRRQLERLENWAALQEGYLLEPSLSRKVEVVTRLEREVHGAASLRVLRNAVVRLGEPFDVRQFAEADGRAPRSGASEAKVLAEARIRELLADMRL